MFYYIFLPQFLIFGLFTTCSYQYKNVYQLNTMCSYSLVVKTLIIQQKVSGSSQEQIFVLPKNGNNSASTCANPRDACLVMRIYQMARCTTAHAILRSSSFQFFVQCVVLRISNMRDTCQWHILRMHDTQNNKFILILYTFSCVAQTHSQKLYIGILKMCIIVTEKIQCAKGAKH